MVTKGLRDPITLPKLGEENVVPVAVPEPTLPPTDQSLPPSDQENILPRMVMLPPLNVLVPVPEEEEIRVKECVRVEGLLVSVRIHQRKDSRGDRVGGGMDRGRRDCPAGYCFGLWGGWNI